MASGESMGWKGKLGIVAGLVILFGPLYYCSGYNLEKMRRQYTGELRNAPEAGDKLYLVGRIYETTLRPEAAQEVWHDFLLHFGGDWSKVSNGQGYFPWEGWAVEAAPDRKLPPPVSPIPHRRASDVCMRVMLFLEVKRAYPFAKHLANVINDYFTNAPPEIRKEAEKYLMRDKTRTF